MAWLCNFTATKNPHRTGKNNAKGTFRTVDRVGRFLDWKPMGTTDRHSLLGWFRSYRLAVSSAACYSTHLLFTTRNFSYNIHWNGSLRHYQRNWHHEIIEESPFTTPLCHRTSFTVSLNLRNAPRVHQRVSTVAEEFQVEWYSVIPPWPNVQPCHFHFSKDKWATNENLPKRKFPPKKKNAAEISEINRINERN
jgi:hypothetical protein